MSLRFALVAAALLGCEATGGGGTANSGTVKVTESGTQRGSAGGFATTLGQELGAPEGSLGAAAPGATTAPAIAANAAGTNAAGTNAAGTNAAGTNAAGTNAAGTNAAGTNAAGTNAAGSNAAGSNAAGSNAAGTNAAGSNAAGTNAAGTNAAGTNAAGSNAAGTNAAGTTAAGTNAAGTNAAGTTAVAAAGTSSAAGTAAGSASAAGAATGSGAAGAVAQGSAAPTKPAGGATSAPPAGMSAGSAAAAGAGGAAVAAGSPTAAKMAKRVYVKPAADVAAIKLELEPNWDRDYGEAGTFSLVVKVPNSDDTRVFAVRYGYDDASAPVDCDQYRKFLADKKVMTPTLNRQRSGACYVESASAFRYMINYGGKRLMCQGSLYKDTASAALGDLRDKVLMQAKKICETLAL